MRPCPDRNRRTEDSKRKVPGKTTKAAATKPKLKRGMDELSDVYAN